MLQVARLVLAGTGVFLMTLGPYVPAVASDASVVLLPVPAGVNDAAAPRALAAQAIALVERGNATVGLEALAHYDRALHVAERYRDFGGNEDYAEDVSLQLGRAFFDRGAILDARRAWIFATTINVDAAGSTLIDEGIVDASKRQFRRSIAKVGAGFLREKLSGQVRFFVDSSISTLDGSPDLQFDRGAKAMSSGDIVAARRWLQIAARADEFPQAELCLALLDMEAGARSSGIQRLLRASTLRTGPWTPDVRVYSSPEGRHAATLLLAMTQTTRPTLRPRPTAQATRGLASVARPRS